MSAAQSSTISPIRWEFLGGLRFALALIVACSHLAYYLAGPDSLAQAATELGAKTAVLGFLLVSGYSIAASLNRSTMGFYRRRLLRIYPLYLFTIVFTLGLQRAVGQAAQMPLGNPVEVTELPAALANLLFLQTFVVKPLAFNGPVWSLAIEVAYYAVAPLFRRLPGWWIPAVIAVSAASYALPRHDDYGWVYFTFTRLNAITYAWAWFGGYMLFFHRGRMVALGFAVLGSALILQNSYLNPERYAVVSFLASLLVVFWVGRPVLRAPQSSVVARGLYFLGDLSYPFYLLHFPILIGAWTLLDVQNSGVVLALALAVSAAAYFLLDVCLKDAMVATARWAGRGRGLAGRPGGGYYSGTQPGAAP